MLLPDSVFLPLRVQEMQVQVREGISFIYIVCLFHNSLSFLDLVVALQLYEIEF